MIFIKNVKVPIKSLEEPQNVKRKIRLFFTFTGSLAVRNISECEFFLFFILLSFALYVCLRLPDRPC